jgi:Short C-terminal domain
VRSPTGRGRQGPGLLGGMGRPVVLPGAPAPVSGQVPAAAGPDQDTSDAGSGDEAPPERQRVDVRQGRWLPRHQPWNAASGSSGGSRRSIDELSAQLDELDELRRAGVLTDDEFSRRRAWLLRL